MLRAGSTTKSITSSLLSEYRTCASLWAVSAADVQASVWRKAFSDFFREATIRQHLHSLAFCFHLSPTKFFLYPPNRPMGLCNLVLCFSSIYLNTYYTRISTFKSKCPFDHCLLHQFYENTSVSNDWILLALSNKQCRSAKM